MVLDVLNQFDFFSAVPLGGSATYEDIARTTNLAEPIVRRILRHARMMRLFAEAPPGSDAVVHTSNTAFLVKQPLLRSWLTHNLEEVRPACVQTPAALTAFSSGAKASEEILESGFSLADVDKMGRPTSFWDYLKHTPAGKPKGFRSKRFAESMQVASMASAISRDDVVKQGFDWAALGDATVVDVSASRHRRASMLISTNSCLC